MHTLQTLALTLFSCCAADDVPINPVPRDVLSTRVYKWTFDENADGWTAQNQCELSARDGSLRIRCTGEDPYFHRGVDLSGGRVAIKIRARCRTAGPGRIFWTTDRSPTRGEDKAQGFSLIHDGQWHESVARFDAPGRLTDLRIDPGVGPGTCEIDWIELWHEEPHPLTIQRVRLEAERAAFEVKNHRTTSLEFTAHGKRQTIEGGETVTIDRSTRGDAPIEAVTLQLTSDGLPPVERTIFVHHDAVQTDWIERPMGPFRLQVARDGSVARVHKRDQLVGVFGPLVHVGGRIPTLKLLAEDGDTLRFEGDGIVLEIATAPSEVSVSIRGQETCEGPVVRAIGSLEQGLLAGVEYLGRGERSSSKLDIETSEHLRFAPDLLDVTMPLMAMVTDRGSVAMTWSDMSLQPLYATPNFFDVTNDHRMALAGQKIDATIRFDDVSLEETILWAVKKMGLPPLPEPPRTEAEQRAICLKALEGPLKNENGWGHCVESRWARRPYADVASTVWRLTGQVPDFPQFVPGGAHVPNGAIYFVTGRADAWLDHQKAKVAGTLRRQRPDGSFRYDGELRRGHHENTASGVCARPAATLLEHAYRTGDKQSLAAGLKALDYMRRFRTPRGAQVWEVPLHTPDQLASAYLVWAYVRGYELTGETEYLREARRWALSGVPFVYLWSSKPIMLYSTPPVFGATHWRHNWIGLPVQWVGGVYAYALTMLAPYDDTLDWNHLARGILLSAEQQQYPSGVNVGLLPDSFALAHQQRRPANINPCAILSLRAVLDGGLDSLAVAIESGRRVVAPFPVTIRDGKAFIRAKKGVRYQVLIDGKRIVDVESKGEDVVELK